MAKPPEPLAELLAAADVVVDAVVERVLSSSVVAPPPRSGKILSDDGAEAGEQLLLLAVRRVLWGEMTEKTIAVLKPKGAYALREGSKGAFLLRTKERTHEEPPTILGRYGPDTWSLEHVEKHMKNK